MWFDNGFKSDDEYTLEELKEFEVNYLTKGGYKLYYKKVNNNQSVLSNGDNFNSEIDLEGRKKEDTSFMQGFEQDPINFDQPTFNQTPKKRRNPSIQEGHSQKSNTIIEKIKEFTTPTKKPRPDYETK